MSDSVRPHVRLCAAHQAPLSLRSSRQEYWSGLPFPSPMHACMLSHFSCVRLCATLWTAAHQAPLSTGFSRQGYWSGLPFPSPSIGLLFLKVKHFKEIFVIEFGPMNSYLWKEVGYKGYIWKTTFSTFPPKHRKCHSQSMTAALKHWG